VCQYLKLSHYAQLCSHLFGYHYAQNYAGIILHGLLAVLQYGCGYYMFIKS